MQNGRLPPCPFSNAHPDRGARSSQSHRRALSGPKPESSNRFRVLTPEKAREQFKHRTKPASQFLVRNNEAGQRSVFKDRNKEIRSSWPPDTKPASTARGVKPGRSARHSPRLDRFPRSTHLLRPNKNHAQSGAYHQILAHTGPESSGFQIEQRHISARFGKLFAGKDLHRPAPLGLRQPRNRVQRFEPIPPNRLAGPTPGISVGSHRNTQIHQMHRGPGRIR